MRKASIPDNPDSDEPPRDRHGDRSVPPPARFSLAELSDDALLTEVEICAHGRWSPCTTQSWRQQPDHPLRWVVLPGGFIRYRVADLREYLASGKPRKRGRPRKENAAPPRRRARARPQTADETAPAEPAQ